MYMHLWPSQQMWVALESSHVKKLPLKKGKDGWANLQPSDSFTHSLKPALIGPVAESVSQHDSGKTLFCSRKLFLNLLGQQTHSGFKDIRILFVKWQQTAFLPNHKHAFLAPRQARWQQLFPCFILQWKELQDVLLANIMVIAKLKNINSLLHFKSPQYLSLLHWGCLWSIILVLVRWQKKTLFHLRSSVQFPLKSMAVSLILMGTDTGPCSSTLTSDTQFITIDKKHPPDRGLSKQQQCISPRQY